MDYKFELPLGYTLVPEALCWSIKKDVKRQDDKGNIYYVDKVFGYYPTLEMAWLDFVDSYPLEVTGQEELYKVILELQKLKKDFKSYAEKYNRFEKEYYLAQQGKRSKYNLKNRYEENSK